jgi:hypothetical protein
MKKLLHFLGIFTLPVLLMVAGCATGTTAKWYAPATWFSHGAADTVDRAEKKESEAQDAAIKQAQKTAHETQLALNAAPDSRPVAVARESNDVTVQLLDQVAGPLTAADAEKLKRMVTGLVSENAAIRAQAEKARAEDRQNVIEISARLARAEAATAAANDKLRAAFERENALANELRSQRALLWIAGGVAVLLGAGWLYVQITLGGLPKATGALISAVRAKHPDIAENLTDLYDTYLDRKEQLLIRKHSA